jgi:hypothetical protein
MIQINNKEVTVKELIAKHTEKVDRVFTEIVNDVLEKHDDWGKFGFEFMITKQKLFNSLLSKSCNLSKKKIKNLSAKDYDLLAFIFLSVNAQFFIQRLQLIKMSHG